MGGGLMQLVAYGAQDVYLTGNPQITFFKVVYRRHTNFAMETIAQTINGTSTLTGSSSSGTVTISRNGDLVSSVYVTSSTASIENGDEIVTEAVLEIGGQQIDKHTKEWNQIWAELTTPESKALAYKNMTGALSHGLNTTGTAGVGMVQVPLNFWFCRNPGLALPLIALQYHEVKLKFTWGTSAAGSVGAAAAVKVWVDYVYLDTDERRRFAQVSHEYLIEQLQYTSAAASTTNKLTFNHPVKELIWTSAATNAYETARLTLNGHDRFADQEEEYFQLRQPYQYHTAVPGANIPMSDRPVMLSAPDRIFDGDAIAGTAANGSATLTATNVTFHAAQALGGADPAARCSVGDILFINLYGASSWGEMRYYVTVTAVTATIITFTAYVDGAATALTKGDNASFGFNDNDDLQITRIASLQDPLSRCSQFAMKINCYSFALKPEEHQPSGTCNFSRIDTAILKTNVALETSDNIYAVNYNVLRIMSGMGGLAYSN